MLLPELRVKFRIFKQIKFLTFRHIKVVRLADVLSAARFFRAYV